MTVDTVLLNFKSALRALTPWLANVGISWKRPDAYDQWDAIASVLFDELVVSTLRWSLVNCGLTELEQEEFRLPPYDLLLPSYQELSTLEVTHPALPASRWLFHAFGTEDEPFDRIEVREVTDDGLPLGENLQTCPQKDAQCSLRLYRGLRPAKVLVSL